MKDKDPNRIAAIENAISKKYGDEAVQNPMANWDEEKEKEYAEQMKELYAKSSQNQEWQDKIDLSGIKVTKKLLNRESMKTCSICGNFPQRSMDDVCLLKFDCCHYCYSKEIEEKEWLRDNTIKNSKSKTKG
tara:strand:+ start:2964 stop:3359 length:396 start_codon:yes stop_codon:yes gene_type:complete